MLHTTVREPDPHAGSRFEEEARQEAPRCAYCDTCEVTNPGEFCSDECQAASLEDANADQALNAERESEVG
jgi:hypothetical protein